MRESYWGYWLILLGIFIIVILMLVQNITSTNTEDYYTLQSITEDAMVDAVDYAYYADYGEIKINKEKFIEVFLRMLAQEKTTLTTTYTVSFTAIYEAPPKVSVEVSSSSNTFSIISSSETFDIVNKIDAVLESGS